MKAHNVAWMPPSPLWLAQRVSDEGMRPEMKRPALLRFATDSFMDEFFAMLERNPLEMTTILARPETWRNPIPRPQGASVQPQLPRSKAERKMDRLRLIREWIRTGKLSSLPEPETPGEAPLKLYHPAHQRYYLVSACLICKPTILGDHKLNTELQERVGFVVRRLLPAETSQPGKNAPDDSWDEYAFVAAPEGRAWERIVPEAQSVPPTLVPGEERLSLFPATFEEDEGRRRRLFTGVVPVTKREEYLGASLRVQTKESQGPPGGNSAETEDPRMILARTLILEPWKGVIEFAENARAMEFDNPVNASDDKKPSPAQLIESLKGSREQIQTASWYILLDFAKFLEDHLHGVWQAVKTGAEPANDKERDLFEALQRIRIEETLINELTNGYYAKGMIIPSLSKALAAIWEGSSQDPSANQIERDLESVTGSYDRAAPDAKWPTFIFPLADPEYFDQPVFDFGQAAAVKKRKKEDPRLERRQAAFERIERVGNLIQAALPERPAKEAPPLPEAARVPLRTGEAWFVIRCVFERPECGYDFQPAVLSERTVPFQLAGFFDPDAPARPIRIGLPLDTTPAGLRKFDKNTAFMMSDILCGQIQRVKGLGLGDLIRSVLPWPLHKDLSVPDQGPCSDSSGATAGTICSLSIPIITICALIVLMVFVSLLDMIFRWLPYFMICFPLPGFKGKKNP